MTKVLIIPCILLLLRNYTYLQQWPRFITPEPNKLLRSWHRARSTGSTVSVVSPKIDILKLVKRIFEDTYVLLRCFSQSLCIVLRCGGQLLNVTFSFLSAMCIRWPGFVPIKVSCRCVIGVVWLGLVCCTRLIRTLIIVCSARVRLYQSSTYPSCGH